MIFTFKTFASLFTDDISKPPYLYLLPLLDHFQINPFPHMKPMLVMRPFLFMPPCKIPEEDPE